MIQGTLMIYGTTRDLADARRCSHKDVLRLVARRVIPILQRNHDGSCDLDIQQAVERLCANKVQLCPRW